MTIGTRYDNYALGFKAGTAAPVQNISPGIDEWPESTAHGSEVLAHILWRNAKQLVSLLEKKYDFGQESQSYS